MTIAICPGSFDPVTNGHIDIIERAAKIFDIIDVAVFHNPSKVPWFSFEERVEMLYMATNHLPNVQIGCFSGMLTEYVRKKKSNTIIRGLRALSDFENEFRRALLIKRLEPDIETLFMMTSSDYSFVSSSGIKELVTFGGSVSGLVPSFVEERLRKKMLENK